LKPHLASIGSSLAIKMMDDLFRKPCMWDFVKNVEIDLLGRILVQMARRNNKVGSWLLVQITRKNSRDGSWMLLFRQYKGIVMECYL
jgi:hypothetical protein